MAQTNGLGGIRHETLLAPLSGRRYTQTRYCFPKKIPFGRAAQSLSVIQFTSPIKPKLAYGAKLGYVRRPSDYLES